MSSPSLSLLGGQPRGFAAEASLPLTAGDRSVLAFAEKYGTAHYFAGGGVLGRLNRSSQPPMTVLVRVDDLAALQQALASKPFRLVYGKGDSLSFVTHGASYQLENLPPGEYENRLASFQSPSGTLFAHEAAHYDLARKQVIDPKGAIAGGKFQLLRTSAPTKLVDRVSQLIRGLVDAARFGLTPDAEFEGFHRQTLSAFAASADAETIASLILGAVAPLGGARQAAILSELATSTLAESSLSKQTGLTAAAAESSYQNLRAVTRSLPASNGALWLAALLGPTLAKSGVRLATRGADYFTDLQTRAAVAEARRLLQTSASADI